MIRIKGMDFMLRLSQEDCRSLIDAWRQYLIGDQQHVAYELLDRFLHNQTQQISKDKHYQIDLENPEQPLQAPSACELLSHAVAQVAADLAIGAVIYSGFPQARKEQLYWLTWNVLIYEQLANYLFAKDVGLRPLDLGLKATDELVVRALRSRVHQQDYLELIGNDFVTHHQAAEIVLENINDTIDCLQRLESANFSPELDELQNQRSRLLIGLQSSLQRCPSAIDTT